MKQPEPTAELETEADSPPSVIFCITELDPGGAEKALVRFARGLHERGWSVHVVSLRDAGVLSGELEASGIRVTALDCGGFADLRAVPRLASLVRQLRPDILVCFLHQANIVGRIAGWLAGVKHVVSGIRVADRRRIVVWADWLTQRLSCHYFAVSQHVAQVHGQLCGIPSSKITVLYNGVDVADSSLPGEDRQDGLFRVLFVGRLTEQKQPVVLVHAVAALPDELLNRVKVDMLGDGELLDAVRKAILDFGLTDRVELHGHHADLNRWWAQADILVLPSAWEGLPNVVLEAMARRVPVIASAVDGIPEVICDGETGWLVQSGNVGQLTDAIVRAESSADDRQRLADRAFEVVRQRFCWQSAIERLAGKLLLLHENGTEMQKH